MKLQPAEKHFVVGSSDIGGSHLKFVGPPAVIFCKGLNFVDGVMLHKGLNFVEV